MSTRNVNKECKEGIEIMKNISNKNREIEQANDINQKKYDNDYNNWKNDKKNREDQINRWKQRIGEYSRFEDQKQQLINEKRTWNNCVYKHDAEGGKHNDWCVRDIGQGWVHTGMAEGCQVTPLVWGGKGLCQRTPAKVLEDMSEYYRNEPIVFNIIEPILKREAYLPLPTLVCCSSQVEVINSSLTATSIQQLNECSNTTNNNSASSSTTPGASTTTPGASSTTPTVAKPKINTTLIIGIVILIIFLTCLFSSSIGAIVYSGDLIPPMYQEF